MSGFDWEALAQLGITRFRLKPDELWQLTPAELWLMAGPVTARAIGRDALGDLMARFPDNIKDQNDG